MIETYCFQTGSFECIVINDGYLTVPSSNQFFSGADEGELQEAFARYDILPDYIRIPVKCLLVDTGTARVLIDCGMGLTPQFPELGRLKAGLEAESIKLESITHVFLSHGHIDHALGIADANNNPIFVNARYMMVHTEWDYWVQTASPDAVLDQLRQRFLALEPQFDLIEDTKTQIVDGITIVPTPGHSIAHCSIIITSGSEQLLCTVDAIVHPIHLEKPTWSLETEYDVEQSLITRRHVIDMAVHDNLLVYGSHFEFPGLGYIKAEGEAWCWSKFA